jgi:hypothetical protein
VTMIETVYECTVSGVWCNHYRSGNDWTPYHQDQYDDRHMFTYSFGATRRFLCRPISGNGNTTLSFDLVDGDLFYFSPQFDRTHKHSIPKTKKDGSRISIVLFTDQPGCRSNWRQPHPPKLPPSIKKGMPVEEFFKVLGLVSSYNSKSGLAYFDTRLP